VTGNDQFPLKIARNKKGSFRNGIAETTFFNFTEKKIKNASTDFFSG